MNETNISTNGTCAGQSQYRATRIWYEIVNSFYANVILKKHWRNFRTYPDCFAASEAIDWLFGYLKTSPNFKSHTSITRQQAIQLLQIFLKEKIIEDVRASNEKYIFKPFSDDDRLYKFNTTHRLYVNKQVVKPDNESIISRQSTDISTINDTTETSGFNEKSVDIEIKSDNSLINESKEFKLESTQLDKENKSRHDEHRHRNMIENEIWSEALHEMLESIVNRAILNSIQTETQHSKKPRHSFNSDDLSSFNEVGYNLDELLFDGQQELTKNKLTGSYVNHNCNHINKHGVVTETDGRQERNEFPKFEDVYSEINNYFNEISEPLLTKDISHLLFQIMKLLLLPQFYVQNNELVDDEEEENSIIHEKNTKIFENLMNSLSQHLASNHSFQNNDITVLKQDMYENDEEAHLLEAAKLPLLQMNSNDSIFNPDCCEDCSLRHNLLNNFINTSAIEFNEFVSSINDLGFKDQIDLLKRANEDEVIDEDEQYDEFDQELFNNDFKLKQAEDKFSRLKLNSPFKPKKITKLNRSISKKFAEKRLHRNNSFRTAIGDIGSFLKSSTAVQKQEVDCQETKSVKELLKKFDDSIREETKKTEILKRTCSIDDGELGLANIVNSCSMNPIQNQSLDAIRKRKLVNTFHTLNDSRLNTYNSLNNFGMTPSLPRNYSFDHQKLEQPFINTTLPRLSMSSLKSYDLSDVITKTENTASLNNLTDDNLIEIKNKNSNRYKNRLSNLSMNTLNSLIFTTMNGSIKDIPQKETLRNDLKLRQKILQKKFSLTAEIESETLCFMVSAFRLCALMLPPANKRKLHLLLRFLYKLKCDQNSAKYLLAEDESNQTKDYEDFHFIDSSIITNNSIDFLKFSKQNDSSLCDPNQRYDNTSKLKFDLKEMESKSKLVEKFIIKSFFKPIVSMQNDIDLEVENEILGMKLIQILINHYPEVMRIPDELVKNVSIIKASKLNISSINSKISLWQYDKQTAENSKQHLADLLNNILTDMSIKDEDKLQRLKKFKEMHPNIYEEKYSTIKKALNILGLNNSESFLVPNIDKTSKSYYLGDKTNRRDSTYMKNRSHMAKSAKKKTSSTSFQMNQTVSFMQPSYSTFLTKNVASSSIGVGIPKFLLNKLKKDI